MITEVYIFNRFTTQTASEYWLKFLDTFPTDSLGSPFYIIRELLDAIFYALGDGQQPFLITVCAIALNATLDWLFTSRFHLGAQGLVYCNLISATNIRKEKNW